ncbi:hypothetical protein EVAR_99187_1 [Eumeta japonica]|uniref:Uncharacterized protein n=1 Tax=Eumeta variegata TaxID=151549 RepID=A0A4C1YT42_EUMVA|nr:hypothetical protein EVAR_99187_1 [Eumeta japonica]
MYCRCDGTGFDCNPWHEPKSIILIAAPDLGGGGTRGWHPPRAAVSEGAKIIIWQNQLESESCRGESHTLNIVYDGRSCAILQLRSNLFTNRNQMLQNVDNALILDKSRLLLWYEHAQERTGIGVESGTDSEITAEIDRSVLHVVSTRTSP